MESNENLISDESVMTTQILTPSDDWFKQFLSEKTKEWYDKEYSSLILTVGDSESTSPAVRAVYLQKSIIFPLGLSDEELLNHPSVFHGAKWIAGVLNFETDRERLGSGVLSKLKLMRIPQKTLVAPGSGCFS